MHGDEQDDSLDVSVETLPAPNAGQHSGTPALQHAAASRLSTRGKLRRAGVAVLAVILALGVMAGGQITTLLSLVPHAGSARQPLISMPVAESITARAPVPLEAGPWQTISLPAPRGSLWSYAPVPSNPASIYVCATTGNQDNMPTLLWHSPDAGLHWQRTGVDLGRGTACQVQIADDGLGRRAVLVEGGPVGTFWSGCVLSRLYLSRDDGASWHALDPSAPFPPVERETQCTLTLTSHHFYAYYTRAVSTTNGVLRSTVLRRSDDGRDFGSASTSLPVANTFGLWIIPQRDDDTLIATMRFQVGDQDSITLVRSTDAGGHWTFLANTEAFAALMVSPEPFATRGAVAARMLYGVSGIYVPEDLYRTRAIQSTDGRHWQRVPPLPVTGATPEREGLSEVAGVAADGKLLVLGVDPQRGVPGTPSPGEVTRTDAPWLWAWDPQARRWEVPQAPLPATRSMCSDHCWMPQLTWGAGPNGTGYGTYVWIVSWRAEAGGGTTTSLYRAYLPSAGHTR